MTDTNDTGPLPGTTEQYDERDGTREVLVPSEDSQGEHYHVRGGCGGHRLTLKVATAERLVDTGLRPCSARGCEGAGVPKYSRCDGCGKPVFDAVVRGENIRYCHECADYLEEHPEHEGHMHYCLRTDFTGTVVQTGDPLILDNGTATVSVRDSPETPGTFALGQQVEAVGTVTKKDDEGLPRIMSAHKVRANGNGAPEYPERVNLVCPDCADEHDPKRRPHTFEGYEYPEGRERHESPGAALYYGRPIYRCEHCGHLDARDRKHVRTAGGETA